MKTEIKKFTVAKNSTRPEQGQLDYTGTSSKLQLEVQICPFPCKINMILINEIFDLN